MSDETIESDLTNVSLSQSEDDVEKRESENNKQNNEGNKDVIFKKPELIIGPRRHAAKFGLRKIGRSLESKSETVLPDSTTDDKIDNTEITEETTNKEVVKKHVHNAKQFPYKEPPWRGVPTTQYSLEELKNGTIIKVHDISHLSFVIFGRLDQCHITMAHPTISRFHVVLQYRAQPDEHSPAGFYVYDLGSTHGTFLNKQRLKPQTYIHMKVGYILKFGCSTRLFIFHGPPEDEEPESELTITEVKEKQKMLMEEREQEKQRLELEEEERKRKEEEKGIDWGMGEDADEETDLTENPYATTQNEDLYLDDPKKTLRGWFEREGEELEYDVEEKGFGHFVCKVQLPVDSAIGGNLVAEASVKGKKKEAVAQCALEACRLLDRYGLLRQANKEPKKRVEKDWEANDYYDSDEDNFLDRTGEIEKKRKTRMAQLGKLESVVETYDTLMEKYNKVVAELEAAETKLNQCSASALNSGNNGPTDELDAFMENLKNVPIDKAELRRLRVNAGNLRKEEERLRKLVNIARPAELPPLQPVRLKLSKMESEEDKKTSLMNTFVNKKKTNTGNKPAQPRALPRETTQQMSEDAGEEFDDDDDDDDDAGSGGDDYAEEKLNTGGTSQPAAGNSTKRKARSRTRIRQRQTKVAKVESVFDEEYNNCTWVPPSGQTGDGRTSLNDKFGY